MTEAMIRKKPGMASVKDMPLLQDGPPPGGFAPVRYARRISNTGPSAMAIFLTVSGAFAWGKLVRTFTILVVGCHRLLVNSVLMFGDSLLVSHKCIR
ncbi:hypothetical protein YC2023_104605 [Brassica napus]|uniref:NADH dehydrogenase [ubiquinone] 1 alpha subcomplex subunit 13 n=1 Tax=Brassica cretica TaxID=69181 RepID=A0ABQ7AM37_BRACR|nr:hypothetical protein DY000_02058237 [Brassica cretica]